MRNSKLYKLDYVIYQEAVYDFNAQVSFWQWEKHWVLSLKDFGCTKPQFIL
jgi:hypothetical protein